MNGHIEQPIIGGHAEYPFGHINSAGYSGHTPAGFSGHSEAPGFIGFTPIGAIGWVNTMGFDGIIIHM